MWVRDFRTPPKALALFQVYHRFAPLSDFRGLTWRIQVEEDVCLQAFLVAGPSQGSFLHVRRRPTLELTPPLMRIEGQLESPFWNELPVQAWIARGTRWWLRNLGSVLVDKPLRLTLLNGLVDMDRAIYPELESAIAYHPIIPLVNGDWISLDQLRSYSQVYQSDGWPRGWHDGVPVIQTGGALDHIQDLIDQPVLSLQGPKTNEIIRWSYNLETDYGPATLTHYGSQHYRKSNWILGRPEAPDFCSATLFDDSPLSLCIAIDFRRTTPPYGVPKELREAVQRAILREASPILLSLQGDPGRLHEICGLLVLMRKAGQQPPEEIWSLRYDAQHRLGQVRDGEVHPLGAFDSDHPILQLRPGAPGFEPVALEEVVRTDLFQLSWAQKCGQHRIRLQFLARRDGMSSLTVSYQDGWLDQSMLQLWEDWPFSLDIRITEKLKHQEISAENWCGQLKSSLEKEWETPLRLLETYPEALGEVCCMVGIGLQSGRRPPGWVWDFQDPNGKTLGELVRGSSLEYSTKHPLSRLKMLLKR